MGVVVRELETVDPGARKDEEIRKGNGDPSGPGAIGELNRPTPDLSRNLVVGKQRLIAAKGLAFGVVGDATPQFESHGRTPRSFAALQERIHAIAFRRVTALAQLVHPERAIDEDGHSDRDRAWHR